MLKYSLIENRLITGRNNYLARIKSLKSYDKAKFIERLVGKGTLVTETDAVAALNAIENTVVEIIKEGGTLNLPLFNTSFSISGVFDSPSDNFDVNRHKLNIKLTKGTLLRAMENRVPVEKVNMVIPQPRIVEVKDLFSGKTNEVLTGEGVIVVRGDNIKIAGDHPECGLWFIGNGVEIKAEIPSENMPSMLIARTPAFAKGTYQIKVVTQYTQSVIVKTPKVYIYPKMLKVL